MQQHYIFKPIVFSNFEKLGPDIVEGIFPSPRYFLLKHTVFHKNKWILRPSDSHL